MAPQGGRGSMTDHLTQLEEDRVDKRPWFEASFTFQARNMEQAEGLFEDMERELGCAYFRVGSLHRLESEDE